MQRPLVKTRRIGSVVGFSMLVLLPFGTGSAQEELSGMECASTAWMLSSALEANIGVFEDDLDMSEYLLGAAVVLTLAAAEDAGCTMDGDTAFITMQDGAEEARLGMVTQMTTYGTPIDIILRNLSTEVEACIADVGPDRMSSLAEGWGSGDLPCGWQP